MIYIVCFCVSAMFAYFANKTQSRKMFLLFSVLSIAITVLLAGLRDYSIGIDVKNYLSMERFWAGAMKAESLGEYLGFYLQKGYREPLFALFIGLIAQMTGQYRAFLFLSHLVIVSGVYIGACRMEKHARPELILLLFYLLYFNNSLNIIRQYMAMALIFSVFADLEQRKFIRYFIMVFVASLIHTTALLALVLPVVYMILYSKKAIGTTNNRRVLFLCLFVVAGTIAFVPTVNFCMQTGILSSKYAYYFAGEYTRMSFTRMGLLGLEIMGLVLCHKNMRKNVPHNEYYLVHTVIFMCLQILSTYIVYGNRIPLYFAFVNIVTVLMIPEMLEAKKWKVTSYIVIIALTLYFWYYQYVGARSSETYPYISCF